jgi:hypothetical protein
MPKPCLVLGGGRGTRMRPETVSLSFRVIVFLGLYFVVVEF